MTQPQKEFEAQHVCSFADDENIKKAFSDFKLITGGIYDSDRARELSRLKDWLFQYELSKHDVHQLVNRYLN